MSVRFAVGALLVVTHAWIWNEPVSAATGIKELDSNEQELFARSKANDSWFRWWHESDPTEPVQSPKASSWWESLFEFIPQSTYYLSDQPWWRTLWTATDLFVVGLLNITGGLLFGHYWPVVRVCLRMLLGLSVIFAASLALGFAWQAVSPVYNLVTMALQVLLGTMMGLQALLKPSARALPQIKALQRGIRMWGPQADSPIDTETLRTFKRVGAHVLGLDEGNPVLFHVEGRIGAINRHGLVLPGSLTEGSGPHKGHRAQRLHLCRQHPCQSAEVGCLHVQAYGLLGPEDELHPLECWRAVTTQEQRASAWTLAVNWWIALLRAVLHLGTCGLCRRRAQPAPILHPVSESENEEEHKGCEAGLVKWIDKKGVRVGLSMRGPCEEGRSETPTNLLMDDIIGGSGGRTVAHLCWRHSAQYERERARCRCPVAGCLRAGKHLIRGVHYCQAHAEEHDAEQRHQLGPQPLLSSAVGRFRVASADQDDVQPATPPAGPSVERAAIERSYSHDPQSDYPQSPPLTARSITSPIQTPRQSVSELIRALPPENVEVNIPSDYEVLHLYLEKRASGSLRGGRLSDEEVRRQLQSNPEVGRGDRLSLLRALIGGVQELSEAEQGVMMHQCQVWMQELYPEREVPSLPVPANVTNVTFRDAPIQVRQESAEDTAGYQRSVQERGRVAHRTTDDRGMLPSAILGPPPGITTPGTPAGLLHAIESTLSHTSKGTSSTVQALQQSRRSGAPATGLPPTCVGGVNVGEDNLRSMGELARIQLEEKRGERGTLKGITREDEDITLLLRCCNRYTVQICPETTGRALYKGMKNASIGAGGHMRQVGWPVPMKNRVALGFAGCLWGGRSHIVLDSYALGAADFPQTTAQEMDDFLTPTGDSLEARPRHPTTWETWMRCARREALAFSLVYGSPWREQMCQALDQLEHLHEGQPSMWPCDQIYSLWEELMWRLMEEMREMRRQMLKEAGREHMTKEEIVQFCLLPDCDGHLWWKVPLAFMLDHPRGWFMVQVLPRVMRKHERVLWGLTWQPPKQSAGHGARAGGEKPNQNPSDSRNGTQRSGATGGASTDSSFPAGKPLGPQEQKLAAEHAPKDREGRSLCWNNMCWSGCSKTSETCAKSHHPYHGALDSLHWCVQAQLIRRGGLRQGKKVAIGDIDGRVAQLRSTAKAEEAAKRADGGSRKTGETISAHPLLQAWEDGDHPSFTSAEKDLHDLCYTPHQGWLADADKTKQFDVWPGSVDPYPTGVRCPTPEADCTPEMSCYLQARQTLNPSGKLTEFLNEAVAKGAPALAKEASQLLMSASRAGSHGPRVEITATNWTDVHRPGQGSIKFDDCIRALYDFGEQLPLNQHLREQLQLPDDRPERRQCLLRCVAGGLLLATTGQCPTMAAVDQLALELREELHVQALCASSAMGEASGRIPVLEHELRTHVHDILSADHDRDYR
eukprot:6492298-Amphidinium_carterae.1